MLSLLNVRYRLTVQIGNIELLSRNEPVYMFICLMHTCTKYGLVYTNIKMLSARDQLFNRKFSSHEQR